MMLNLTDSRRMTTTSTTITQSSTTSAVKSSIFHCTPLHTNTVSTHPTAEGTAYRCLSRMIIGTSFRSMSRTRPPPSAVNMPMNTAVMPEVPKSSAFEVPFTANKPTAKASMVSIDHLSLSTSGWITAIARPDTSAVSTNPRSEMPTGGREPSITSRMMPPPNAVSHAVISMANRS